MIVGLTGLAGSGKSMLAKKLGDMGFMRVNFKDALVEEIYDRFPDLLRELSEAYHMDVHKLFENKPAAMRALMQNYGTDVRRTDDPQYWTNKWHKSVEGLLADRRDIVVDDVRFLNEADAVRLEGGFIVQVEREGTKQMNHVSETEMAEIWSDYVVTNNGTKPEAMSQMLQIIGFER